MMKTKNPILILGGFLITPEAYLNLKNTIEAMDGKKVFIIEVSRFDWLRTNSIAGWTNILNKVHSSVLSILKETNSQKIDLIGHSSGGLILRLYLANDLFNGLIYDGKSITSNLITLGSPHQAKRSTSLRKYVDKKYPSNFYKDVNYVSVGGIVDVFSEQTSLFTKIFARSSYKSISGLKNLSGDGLVPLKSSLLNGSQQIIAEDTVHGGFFGKHWYGSSSRIEQWYKQINWI